MARMTDTPTNIRLQPGTELVALPDGTFEVQPTGERRRMTLSFRLTPLEYASVAPFLKMFTSTSEAIRWLLAHDDVRALMADRMKHSSRPRIKAAP